MFLEIVKAEYLENYKVKLWFNDNVVKIVDLSNYLSGEVFTPLKDIDYFKNFTIQFNTIAWENGADFALEFLYEIGKEI